MGAEETPLKGSGGGGSFVGDVKELRRGARSPVEEGAVTGAVIGPYRGSKFQWTSSTRIRNAISGEEVRGHGAIQVREVWEDVFQGGELLRGAHEGVQVVRDGFCDGGWGEVTLAPAVSRPRSR
jgi:hypothetical protein